MRTQLTPQQVVARDTRRARFRELARQIAALSDVERTALADRMHVATIEGRTLSVHNACLVGCQDPQATLVGGFRQWKTHGRIVRKGEHGLMIWAPTKRANGGAPSEHELDNERPAFIMVTVFDVAQTDEMDGL